MFLYEDWHFTGLGVIRVMKTIEEDIIDPVARVRVGFQARRVKNLRTEIAAQ